MPRRNRRQRGTDLPDVSRLAHGGARVEVRRGSKWYVRTIPASRAVKEYRCPGCQNSISSGTEHVVAWEADGLLGAHAAARGRRHWHSYCWRLA